MKHKYIFYIFAKGDLPSDFRVTGHSKKIKEWCKKNKRLYDFKKLY